MGEDPIGFASGDFNFYRYVGDDPLNRIDPFGLEESFSNPAVCIAVAVGKTGKSIKKCNDLVMDAYLDYAYMRNDDYSKMCPGTPASPTACACGCLATDFYENLKKHCKPKLKKPKLPKKAKGKK